TVRRRSGRARGDGTSEGGIRRRPWRRLSLPRPDGSRDCFAIGGDRGGRRRLPRELALRHLPCRLPLAAAEGRVPEQPFDRGSEGDRIARRDEETGYAVVDRVVEASDRSGNDGPSVRHRLARDHAVALPVRGTHDDRGALVVRAEPGGSDEADSLENAR